MPPLCAPIEELSCFGCCPPIRPYHYDPLDFMGSLRRELIENREAFLNSPLQVRPIVGYHCWALGFLDPRGRTAGCLLHPARNDGEDLRGLVDYGSKCRRESCRAARVFDELPPEGHAFWLELARGLNPFYYSSHRGNPLFHILLWGAELLERLRCHAGHMAWTSTELIYFCPFLVRKAWKPQAHRFLFSLLLDRLESVEGWTTALEASACRLLSGIPGLSAIQAMRSGSEPCGTRDCVWTHQASERADLLDFVRLELGIRRAGGIQLRKAGEAIIALAEEMPVFIP